MQYEPKKLTAEDYIKKIRNEMPYVDVKPYSHNIITICLNALAELGWNDEQIDQLIQDEGLNSLGW